MRTNKKHELNKVHSWVNELNANSGGGVYPIDNDQLDTIQSMTAKQLKLMARMISSANNLGHAKNRAHWVSMTRDQRRTEVIKYDAENVTACDNVIYLKGANF